LAHSLRRGWTPAPSLSTVEIVSEAYLRMRGGKAPVVTDRRHFMNLAAKTMRWIIISHYRNALRRPQVGGEGTAASVEETHAHEYIALDAALERLEGEHPDLAQLVELRYFLGRDMREIAEIMEIPERSLYRLWERARRWLHRAMETPGARA
jgi:RNA polymerase sigma factor (TIGR02999 family)